MVVSRSYVVLLEMTVLHPSKHCRALGSRAQRYAEEDEGVELRLLAPTFTTTGVYHRRNAFFSFICPIRPESTGNFPFREVPLAWGVTTALTRRMHRAATASTGPMMHHSVP